MSKEKYSNDDKNNSREKANESVLTPRNVEILGYETIEIIATQPDTLTEILEEIYNCGAKNMTLKKQLLKRKDVSRATLIKLSKESDEQISSIAKEKLDKSGNLLSRIIKRIKPRK